MNKDLLEIVLELFSNTPYTAQAPQNILEKLKVLELALFYVIKNNKANLAPYHNLQHTLIKIIESHKNLEFCANEIESSIQYTFSIDDYISLFLADIFHDFNHSQGILLDSSNIIIAKQGFDDFTKQITNKNQFEYLNYLKPFVYEIIEATQFPYLDLELNLFQKISRDSDMSSIFYEGCFQTNILGLFEEIRKQNKELTLEKHLINQHSFLFKLKIEGFYTNYANKYYLPLLDSKIDFLINSVLLKIPALKE